MRSIGFMNAGIADPEVRKKKLNAELANGRLAMFAIIGMFFQDPFRAEVLPDECLLHGATKSKESQDVVRIPSRK